MSDNKKKVALVVEDDKALSKALTMALTKKGLETHAAYDGKEGLEKTLDLHPDVILLDLKMPVMDGKEYLTQLRKDEWGKKASVLVCTQTSDPKSIVEMEKLKAKCYMIKSDWKLSNLMENVMRYVNKEEE